ncbi:hypothetical protein M404DRAFT_1005439 [Pisolithus tinctorius Marx 270]|uniref:Uncharacterized protein n=1 Tax=Pisolithus tinctorius Marx 270 TaxID=870435 RepID=A0A0C3JL46_PISTI|nr:hypothetical protein M404DRAFT_1005439 [Pisolithus tinctorius Marx 270]
MEQCCCAFDDRQPLTAPSVVDQSIRRRSHGTIITAMNLMSVRLIRNTAELVQHSSPGPS